MRRGVSKGNVKWRPAPGLGLTGKGSPNPFHGVSPTTANLIILGSGLGLGLITYQYRENPIGATLLGAAGSMTAVALVLFLRDLLVADRSRSVLDA